MLASSVVRFYPGYIHRRFPFISWRRLLSASVAYGVFLFCVSYDALRHFIVFAIVLACDWPYLAVVKRMNKLIESCS